MSSILPGDLKLPGCFPHFKHAATQEQRYRHSVAIPARGRLLRHACDLFQRDLEKLNVKTGVLIPSRAFIFAASCPLKGRRRETQTMVGLDAAPARGARNPASDTPRATVRSNYVGLPTMAGRGTSERRRNLPG